MEVSTGRVVGIGRLVMEPLPHIIPPLSFVVTKDEFYTAVCPELYTLVTAETEKESVDTLVYDCIEGTRKLFELLGDEAWENLKEVFENPLSQEYSRAFNRAQIELAKKGIRVYPSELEQWCYVQL